MKIIEDMSNEDYHNHKSISSSRVKVLLENPYEYLNPIEKDSKAFSLGSATHSLVLEPHKFDNEFAVAPSLNRRTKKGKEEYLKFEDENIGKTVLLKEEFENAKNIAKSVLDLNLPFLKDGITECSFFSKFDGVDVRCRPDYYKEDMGIVVDLKTTDDASLKGFAKSVANFGYHTQASFYLKTLESMGLNAFKFVFIAVEKKPPYMVGIYELDYESLQKGCRNIEKAFKLLNELDSFKTNIYKNIDTKQVVQTIKLPKWAK